MTQQQPSKSRGFKSVLRTVAFVALAVAAASFAAPAMRKTDALNRVGERTVTELSAVAAAVSYYSGEDIARLAQKPEINADYTRLSGLLARIAAQQDYRGMYLLTRDQDGRYHVLVDGAYRDGSAAKTDSYAPGADYPADVYRASKGILDRIYSGKTDAGFAGDIITRSDRRLVSASYLAVYGAGRTVLGVLAAERDPGDTGYHMVGPVNLRLVGVGAAVLFAVCAVLLRLSKTLENRRRAAPASAPAQQPDNAAPEPEPDGQTGAAQDKPQ